MTEDRELTKWAAKAAGLWDAENDCVDIPWNPLHDDGDALRLAVKLCIDIHTEDDGDGLIGTLLPGGLPGPTQRIEGCPYTATRRAIVRAAAAIGERMQ